MINLVTIKDEKVKNVKKIKDGMENLSLFGMDEAAQQQLDLHGTQKLDIVKMEFSGAASLS